MVRLWDPDTGQQSGALHGMTETVTDLAWTCDAKFLLASGADQAVRMWDVSSGRAPAHAHGPHAEGAPAPLAHLSEHPRSCHLHEAKNPFLHSSSSFINACAN